MYFDGQKVPDNGTLKDYGIEEDDIVDCFRDPRESPLELSSDGCRRVGPERVRPVVGGMCSALCSSHLGRGECAKQFGEVDVV